MSTRVLNAPQPPGASTTSSGTDPWTPLRIDQVQARIVMRASVPIMMLRRVLRNAIPFASSRKDDHPATRVIRVEVTGTQIFIRATDGVVLSSETADLPTPSTLRQDYRPAHDGLFYLPVGAARALVQVLPRRTGRWAVLTATESRRAISWQAPESEDPSGWAGAALLNEQPVNRRQLLIEVNAGDLGVITFDEGPQGAAATDLQRPLDTHRTSPVEELGLNPALVAKFAKVVPAEPAYPHMRVLMGGPNQPVRIRIGDRFEGIVAPEVIGGTASVSGSKTPSGHGGAP